MRRSYFDCALAELPSISSDEIIGRMAAHLPFALEQLQRCAWEFEIEHLRGLWSSLPGAHVFFEFMIPRMGRRADVVMIFGGIIFVIEYKVGAARPDRHALNQVYGYGLDLKHFHETSHAPRVVPILVATDSSEAPIAAAQWDYDDLERRAINLQHTRRV